MIADHSGPPISDLSRLGMVEDALRPGSGPMCDEPVSGVSRADQIVVSQRLHRVRGKAHAVIGLAAAAPIAAMSREAGVATLVSGIIGGLVPDLDHPDSAVGRLLPWPVVRDRWRTGRWRPGGVIWHRGEVHSVGCAMIAAAVLALLGTAIARAVPLPAAAVAAFLVGYVSHLVVDMASPSPQMLIWPLSRRYWRPGWLPAVKVDSLAGRMLETVASLIAMGATFASLHNVLPELLSRDLLHPLLGGLTI